jgi:ElaB/YqjD/DUF883 family membrane-anchored ribosome-binding protein
MNAPRDPSVEKLRRESERSRAALTSTVVHLRDKVSDTAEDLKERLSPTHIKEEVKDYVREGSEQFFHSIERKARENPLQAIAIGAGLSYPLWGLLKTIPVPIMLVGTGLWLSRQKADGSDGEGYIRGMARKVSDAGAEGASRVSDAIPDAAASILGRAEIVTERVRATAHDVRDSVSGMGRSVVDSITDNALSVSDSVSATASDLKNKVSELGDQTKNSFVDLVNRNPLLVGGIGLAIGAFIAASLPPSDAENRIFGDRSDELKEKALEAASQGVERAKDVAAGMVDDVAAAAARQGLDAEGLARGVEVLTEGVKSVVDKGLKTALAGQATSPQSTATTFQPNKTNQGSPQ